MNDEITQSETLELEQIIIGLEFRKTYHRYSWRDNEPLNPFEPGDKVLISMTEETEKMIREATEDLVRRLRGKEG